ncbi:hypothetical protein BT69DRAFT_1395164 [Atractiella rhizophila]|nr:hypothetical protein BT69DRAFT_1395164 [Atractiella rhizophila]
MAKTLKPRLSRILEEGGHGSDIAEEKKDFDAKRAAAVEKAVGEKEPIEEQEAIQEHEATVKKASKEPYKKALNDLLFPIPNAKPTSHRTKEQLAYQKFIVRQTIKDILVRILTDSDTASNNCSEIARVDNVIGFFAEELLEAMIGNSKLALKVSGASNVTLSFVEVKKKGVVTEQSFQDVQDLCEVWEKESVARRNKATTWKEVAPRENALYYVYPQILNYMEQYITRLSKLREDGGYHESITLIYVVKDMVFQNGGEVDPQSLLEFSSLKRAGSGFEGQGHEQPRSLHVSSLKQFDMPMMINAGNFLAQSMFLLNQL